MSKHKKKPVRARKPQVEPTEPPKGHLADDDFVYVPRGKSKTAYIFILALMVFTLIMFVVPYGLQSLVSPRGAASETYMSWEHPRLGKRQVSAVDFQNEQRELVLFYHLVGVRNDELTSDQATAAFLVTDALAKEAGVQFGAPDLAEFILQRFGSKDAYQQRMRGATTPARFEATATKVLRTLRYQELIMRAAAVPAPDAVETSWNERHEQFAFEAIGREVEPLLATAESEATDEEALRAWYAALPARSGAFAEDWREAQAAVELAGWPVDSGDDPTALLEAYPVPEGTDLAGLARQYYDANFHTRFLRDEPTTGEDGRPSLYDAFEQVEATAAREAPIHLALGLWRQDLFERLEGGELVDLAAEASGLGLVFVPAAGLRPISAWREAAEPDTGPPAAFLDPFTGRFVEDGIRRADPTSGLSSRVIVERDALVVSHVTERVEAGPAPFEQVRDKVVSEWARERAAQIAVERLREAYDAMAALDTSGGPRPLVDAAAFEAEAQAMGASVQRRDWFDPSARVPSGTEETSLEKYTRRVARRLMLAEGELAEPELDLAKETAWLLRGAGRRPPPALEIEPAEYRSLQQMAAFQAQQSAQELLSFDAFRKLYALRLASPERGRGDEEPAGDGPQG